jgi:hypothetical protein
MQPVMAAAGWHGVEFLSAARRVDVLLFVLGIVGVALLFAFVWPRTDSEKGAGVSRTPQDDVRHPNP